MEVARLRVLPGTGRRSTKSVRPSIPTCGKQAGFHPPQSSVYLNDQLTNNNNS